MISSQIFIFSFPAQPAVSTPAERIRFADTMGGRQPVFSFESLNFQTDDSPVLAYLARFAPAAPKLRLHRHSGFELVFVISGTLCIFIDGVEHTATALRCSAV